MIGKLEKQLQDELSAIKAAGLYKSERVITSPQGAQVTVEGGDDVIIMCANNYLGLSSHPKVIEGGKKGTRFARIWDVISSLYLWDTRYT